MLIFRKRDEEEKVAEPAMEKTESRKQVRKKHKSEKTHSKHKKNCDKKEKSKNKKKPTEVDVNDFAPAPVNTPKNSPKIDVEYPLPMVVVEKMDFSVAPVSKPSDIFNNVNEESKQSINDISNLINNKIENISDNVISDSTKIDITQNVDNLDLNPDAEAQFNNKKFKPDDIDKTKKHKHEKLKRKIKNHDIRKAPELDIKPVIKIETPPDVPEAVPERVAIKIKLCNICNTRHLQEACPLRNPNCVVRDATTLDDYLKNAPEIDDLQTDDDDSSVKNELETFSVKSLPDILYLEDSNTSHGLSVFTKFEIKEYTQFGPIIGKTIKEVDIPEDFGMKHLWEVYSEKNFYVNTEDGECSNWLRYLRPAPNRELRNAAAVSKNDQLYMITTRNIVCGEELLYWQDDALGTNKKKMEKTSNARFAASRLTTYNISFFRLRRL